MIGSYFSLILFVWPSFFNTKDEGWHFYHDKEPITTKKDPDQAKKNSTSLPSLTPHEKPPQNLKELKALAQELLDEAVWQPTHQNIANYQCVQKHLMERSERFATLWAENLVREPDLDNTIDHPTSYYGLLAQKEAQAQQHQKMLQIIAQNFMLVLLVDNTQAAQKLHTIVKTMAQEHRLPLIVVDTHGNIEEPKTKWGVKRLPALVMVELKTGQPHIVHYGLRAQDELEARMIQNLRRIIP